MTRPTIPGWYLLTPAGYAGPYRWRDDAVTANVGRWPIVRVTDDASEDE